eukprot:919203-Pyramimonas_sp.AAC.1
MAIGAKGIPAPVHSSSVVAVSPGALKDLLKSSCALRTNCGFVAASRSASARRPNVQAESRAA